MGFKNLISKTTELTGAATEAAGKIVKEFNEGQQRNRDENEQIETNPFGPFMLNTSSKHPCPCSDDARQGNDANHRSLESWSPSAVERVYKCRNRGDRKYGTA